MKQLFATTFCRRPMLAAVLSGLAILAVPTPAVAAVASGASESADRVSYVLLGPGGRDSMVSGSMEDVQRARSFRRNGEQLLYVRLGPCEGSVYLLHQPIEEALPGDVYG